MELSVSVSSAVRSGGNPTYALAGLYLQSGLGDYGDGIGEIDVTACFRGGRASHPSLQTSYDQYHARFLPTLPYRKFFRKKKRFELSYETAVADAEFLERYGPPAAEVFGPALAELAERLRLLDGRVTPSDGFDLARFHEDVSRLVREAPTSQAAVEALKAQLDEKEKLRLAAMDWWQRTGLDFEAFHPNARRLLDDPLFWDCADDYAPHGNDTGADLLADFEKWNRRHVDAPAHEMARELLESWDIGGVDPDAADEATVRSLQRSNSIALGVTNEAMIAAAFAAVKYRGWCDGRTRELALRAIERERMASGADGVEPTQRSERATKLALLAETLRGIPEAPQTPKDEG